MRYKPDGSPISSSVPVGEKRKNEHNTLFGIFRGTILRPIYPDDPKNKNKERIEYEVKVRGQVFSNAIEMKIGGGKFNYSERVRKATEVSSSGQLNQGTYDELLDGESVYVAFLEGYGNHPLIIGGAEHPQFGKYKKFKKADGLFDISEFNGVEIGVDKDANYTITHKGLKDPKGKIANEKAVGAFIKLFGSGNIEFNAAKTADDKDLKMTFDKAGKKFEIKAQDNIATFDDTGVKITDKNGNIIEMKNNLITVTAAKDMKFNVTGDAEINTTGDTIINSTGDTKITAAEVSLEATTMMKLMGTAGTTLGSGASITKVDGTQVLLAGGGPPVARLGDICVGTGNLGAPVVSNILQGSSKVKAG